MGPKQVRLREVVCEVIPGSKPVGIITFDTGHDAVAVATLGELIDFRLPVSRLHDTRKVYCLRNSAGSTYRMYQRVLGLDAIKATLASVSHRIGQARVAVLSEWFREQGVSPQLWPASEADAVQYNYPEGATGDDGRIRSDVRHSLNAAMAGALAVPESIPIRAADGAVFPYWVSC